MNKALSYRRDIDGLRAVAVLPVVFYHGGIGLFSGGFVGVDVFFVISGYLITSILLREIDKGEFTLAGFYERRVRRIFPALFAMLAITTVIAGFFYTSHDFNELGKSLYSVVLFYSNFYFLGKQGYFDGDAEIQVFLHTWSLAVEEQFYIVFPLILAFLSRYGGGVRAVGVTLLFLISFVAAAFWVGKDQNEAFYVSWLRFWELSAGALLALGIAPKISKPWLAEVSAIGGLLMIAIPVFTYTDQSPFPGLLALPVCLGTVLVIYSGGVSKTSVARLLQLSPLVFFGLISYSLYLWHWPIFVFKRYLYLDDNLALNLVLISLSVLLAWLSWRFVEAPFRSRVKFERKPLFKLAWATGLSALIIAGALDISNGLPQRFPKDIQLMMSDKNRHPVFRECSGLRPNELDENKKCALGDKKGEFFFALWGDSHAEALAPALDKLAKESGVRGWYFSKSACPPVVYKKFAPGSENPDGELLRCANYHNRVFEYLNKIGVDNIVLAARWDNPNDALAESQLKEGLEVLIKSFEAGGKKVWLVNKVPEAGEDVTRVLMSNHILPVDQPLFFDLKTEMARQAQYRAEIKRLQRNYRFQVLNPEKLLCGKLCPMAHDNRSLFQDEHHLSVYGALRIAGLFSPIFEGLNARSSRLLAPHSPPGIPPDAAL